MGPRRDRAGFTLVELVVAVGVMGVLGGVAALAVEGFGAVGSTNSCRADTMRLRKAENAYFLSRGTYTGEAQLVSAGLLEAASASHDVTTAGAAYSISEVGRCVGRHTTYDAPGPTVGTTAHSGTTVSVLAPDGSGVANVIASYAPAGQSTWTTIGTTGSTGSVSASIPDGMYDIRVAYDGATNTLSQVTVTSGTVVTFPAVPLTVRLRDGSGNGQAGGAVTIQASGGATVALGNTPASGDLVTEVLPGTYDVTLAYGSLSSTHAGVAVSGPTIVAFQLCTTTVRLRAVNGAGLAGGVVNVTAPNGFIVSLGTTDASGVVSATLLDGTYDFSMRYAGATSVQTVSIAGTPTVTFQLVTVTVHTAQSTGTALAGSDAATWYRPTGTGTWTSLGAQDSSGNTTVDVLPTTYDFEARWFGVTWVKGAVVVSGTSTVTLQTMSVPVRLVSSTGAPLYGQDAAFYGRAAGTTSWSALGSPDFTGTVRVELFPGLYDFDAHWFGAVSVQSDVTVSATTTVTFATVRATLRLLSSAGTGLNGQDALLYVRPAGTTPWFTSGVPDTSGTVVQELLSGSYDIRTRWLATFAVQSAVSVTAPTTVTFQTKPATMRMLSSTGSGLAGQDEAMYVRQTGTTNWFQTDPPSGGIVVQEVLAGTYDMRARWTGSFLVQSAIAVNSPTTVTFTAVPVVVTCRRASDGTPVSNATGSVVNGSTSYPLGTSDASGVVNMQVFVGVHDFRCKLGVLVGTNANVNIPAGGGSTTVNMS